MSTTFNNSHLLSREKIIKDIITYSTILYKFSSHAHPVKRGNALLLPKFLTHFHLDLMFACLCVCMNLCAVSILAFRREEEKTKFPIWKLLSKQFFASFWALSLKYEQARLIFFNLYFNKHLLAGFTRIPHFRWNEKFYRAQRIVVMPVMHAYILYKYTHYKLLHSLKTAAEYFSEPRKQTAEHEHEQVIWWFWAGEMINIIPTLNAILY